MGALNDNEQRDLEAIREAKRRRLSELELQAAQLGRSTPAEIRVEIKDLRKELGVVDPILKGELSDELLAALRMFGVSEVVITSMQLLQNAINEQGKEIRQIRWLVIVLIAVVAMLTVTRFT